MSSPDAPPAAAGWYPEPDSSGVLRYWNGAAWEDWRQPAVAVPSAPAPTNGIAVTALVFSLVGIALDLTILLAVLGLGCSIVGLICGRIGITRSRQLGRRGMAQWAFWLGLVPVALLVLLFIFIAAFHMRLGQSFN